MDWDWLTDWLNQAFAWLVDLLLWVPLKLAQAVLGALVAILGAIPVPAWAENLSFAGISPVIAYFAGPFHIATGLSVIFGAFFIRFIIRRIPVIG